MCLYRETHICAFICYPSRQNCLGCPSNKPRYFSLFIHSLYIYIYIHFPYVLKTMLCVRSHRIIEPTWVGLGPIEPMRLVLAWDQVPGSCGTPWSQNGPDPVR